MGSGLVGDVMKQMSEKFVDKNKCLYVAYMQRHRNRGAGGACAPALFQRGGKMSILPPPPFFFFAAAMVSELRNLINIYLTVQVTTATSERSFSTLRRIKTYLCSTVCRTRLNNVFLLHAHKGLTDELDTRQTAIEAGVANQLIAINWSIASLI